MFVFYNPHVDDFLAKPPHFRVVGRRPLKKYAYLLDEEIRVRGVADAYFDGTVSAFIPDRFFSTFPSFVRLAITWLEVRVWIAINGFQGKIRSHFQPHEISDRSLLLFSYKAASGAFQLRIGNLLKFRMVIAHLSHYFISTRIKSSNLSQIKRLVLAGDADISTNPYFVQFFAWYKRPLLLIPFGISPRFQIQVPFAGRQPRALATGTFHDLTQELPKEKYEDFIGFFGLTTYHPVRKQLHEGASRLGDHVVVKTSPFRGNRDKLRLWSLTKHFSVAQKQYFGLDIVSLYNSYQFAIVGEEASGFPALGAFEAMACGCVLIADARFYKGLNLVPGTHFADHQGTVESIAAVIDDLTENPLRAAEIADSGHEFVRTTFAPAVLCARINRELASLRPN